MLEIIFKIAFYSLFVYEKILSIRNTCIILRDKLVLAFLNPTFASGHFSRSNWHFYLRTKFVIRTKLKSNNARTSELFAKIYVVWNRGTELANGSRLSSVLESAPIFFPRRYLNNTCTRIQRVLHHRRRHVGSIVRANFCCSGILPVIAFCLRCGGINWVVRFEVLVYDLVSNILVPPYLLRPTESAFTVYTLLNCGTATV